jgi:hypothetical protein
VLCVFVSVGLNVLTNLINDSLRLSGIALGYWLDDRGFESRRGLGIFLFTIAFRPALGPIRPPVKWVPGRFFSRGWSGRSVKLPTHDTLAPGLRTRGTTLPLTSPWLGVHLSTGDVFMARYLVKLRKFGCRS